MRTVYGGAKWAAVIGLCTVSAIAVAQGRGRGGDERMSPEEAAKVWTLEATAVAKALELAEDAEARVVDAFKAAREAQGKAMREAFREGGGGDPAARLESMREISQAHVAKLSETLSAAIGAENGAKAAEQLAPLDRMSDRMAQVLSELNLDEAKLHEAIGHVVAYAADLRGAMEEAVSNADRDATRGARRELKTALDDALAKVLSEEQLAAWKEKTDFRGRGGRDGERRERPADAPAEN